METRLIITRENILDFAEKKTGITGLGKTLHKKIWGLKYNDNGQKCSGIIWFYINGKPVMKGKIRDTKHRQGWIDMAFFEYKHVKGEKYILWQPNYCEAV